MARLAMSSRRIPGRAGGRGVMLAAAAGVALAAAGGIAAALLPTRAALALLATVVIGAGLLAGRRLLARRALGRPAWVAAYPVRAAAGAVVRDTAAAAGGFQLPRLLYCLGLLSIAQLRFRVVSEFTVSDWLFLAAFVAACFEALVFRRPLPWRLPGAVLGGIVLFTIGGLTASIGAAAPVESVVEVAKFAYLTVVWFWLGTVLLREPGQVRLAVLCWLISAAVTGAAAIIQFAWGPVLPGLPPADTRMTGFADHMNDLGGLSAIALIPALALTVRGGPLRRQAPAYALSLLIGAGLVLSGSVGGLFAAAAGGLIWVAFSRLDARLVIWLFVVMAGVFVIYSVHQDARLLSPAERARRVLGPSDDPGATLWTRLETSRAAWQVIRVNPFAGAGLDRADRTTTTGDEVHNMLLNAWFVAGLTGLVGMVLVVVSVGLQGRAAVVEARSREEWTLALALLVAFIVFLGFAMGAPILYKRIGWVTAALILALRAQEGRAPQ